jgi:hypothetical protein
VGDGLVAVQGKFRSLAHVDKSFKVFATPNWPFHGGVQMDFLIANGTEIRIDWSGAATPTYFGKGSTLVAPPAAMLVERSKDSAKRRPVKICISRQRDERGS